MKQRLGLINARKSVSLTQEGLAYAIADTGLSPGVTPDAVSRWERGTVNIAPIHLEALTRVLRFSSVAETIERIDPFGTGSPPPATGVISMGEWEIPVNSLPWRPCIAYSGLAGLRRRHDLEQ